MDIYDSDIFGKIPKPSSFSELLTLLRETPDTPRSVRMWRGQSDISWPIHSSAYRRLTLSEGNPTDQDLISYEKELLKHATHRGYRHFEGTRLNDLDLLARLQHHGSLMRLETH